MLTAEDLEREAAAIDNRMQPDEDAIGRPSVRRN